MKDARATYIFVNLIGAVCLHLGFGLSDAYAQEWEDRYDSTYGWSLQPFISDSWNGNKRFRILDGPEFGVGVVDIRQLYEGFNDGANGSVVRIDGATDTGANGNVRGLFTRLDHKGSADLSPGFTIGNSVHNNAAQIGAAPIGAGTLHLQSYFGITSTPSVDRSYSANSMELNIENKFADLGERWKANDFDLGPEKLTRIFVLKPESNFFVGSSSQQTDGYPVDAYIYLSRDVAEVGGHPVGAYGGMIIRNDAIMGDGTGIRLGGRTAKFSEPEPDVGIRVDHQWKRGIDMTGADFTAHNTAIRLNQYQRVRWETNAGSVAMVAGSDGKVRITGPHGTKVIYP